MQINNGDISLKMDVFEENAPAGNFMPIASYWDRKGQFEPGSPAFPELAGLNEAKPASDRTLQGSWEASVLAE